MAARSVGNATVSFGLVSIPVKLFTATSSAAGVSFNLLHAKCGNRVKQQYVCPVENVVVERSEMIKGYEVSKDHYVTFTPAELEALEAESTESIDIAEFVPRSAVDPVYYDRAYYLSPDKGGDKAFRLLAEVMRRSDKVALGRYAARGKQYLVMLRPGPEGSGLVLQQLLYADEVRPIAEVPKPASVGEVSDKELGLAEQLVDRVSSDAFHPEAYHDEVKDRILAQIQSKAEGHTLATSSAPAPRGKIIDLMEALKQSLASGPEAPSKPKRPVESALTPVAAAETARKPPKRAGATAKAPLKAERADRKASKK